MIAAGTSAPIAIAANATPVNQSGNIASKSAGTAHCVPYVASGFIPAAIAM